MFRHSDYLLLTRSSLQSADAILAYSAVLWVTKSIWICRAFCARRLWDARGREIFHFSEPLVYFTSRKSCTLQHVVADGCRRMRSFQIFRRLKVTVKVTQMPMPPNVQGGRKSFQK